MQRQMKYSFANAAESCDPASYNTSASDVYFTKILTAIIVMMAVILSVAVHPLDILISIITGAVILVIVRSETGTVSRP